MLIRLFSLATISLIYTQHHLNEWGSITSLITPKGIEIAESGIVYIATSGGLLEFNPTNQEYNIIGLDEGLIYLDISTIEKDSQGRLWLGGAYPNGYLQVYDPEHGMVRKITHLNAISEIGMIQICSQKAYAIYLGRTSGDIGILEFDLDEEGLPNYHDYYVDFSSTPITEIRDFDVYQDSLLYVTTDQGIFAGNKTDHLKLPESWDSLYEGNDAYQFLPINNGVVITDSIMFSAYNENISFDIFNLWHYCEKPDSEGNLVECPSPKSDDYCEEYVEINIALTAGAIVKATMVRDESLGNPLELSGICTVSGIPDTEFLWS